MIELYNISNGKTIQVPFGHAVNVLLKQGSFLLDTSEMWLANYNRDDSTGLYPDVSDEDKAKVSVPELIEFLEVKEVPLPYPTTWEMLMPSVLRQVNVTFKVAEKREEVDGNVENTNKRSTRKAKRKPARVKRNNSK